MNDKQRAQSIRNATVLLPHKLPVVTGRMIKAYEDEQDYQFTEEEKQIIIKRMINEGVTKKRLDVEKLTFDDDYHGLEELFEEVVDRFVAEITVNKTLDKMMEGKKSSSSWLCLSIFT